ncbi:hypothetical protein FACS189472_08480 [Alphaproteobacteria bacterium]|nr:hypothetical protein FACS189472_08480 [Alphaproteobacteria bacterium]
MGDGLNPLVFPITSFMPQDITMPDTSTESAFKFYACVYQTSNAVLFESLSQESRNGINSDYAINIEYTKNYD